MIYIVFDDKSGKSHFGAWYSPITLTSITDEVQDQWKLLTIPSVKKIACDYMVLHPFPIGINNSNPKFYHVSTKNWLSRNKFGKLVLPSICPETFQLHL